MPTKLPRSALWAYASAMIACITSLAAGAAEVEGGGGPGTAKVCVDPEVFSTAVRRVELPATTVFRDAGPLKGDRANSELWSSDHSTNETGAIATLAPLILTAQKPCAEVSVTMVLGPLRSAQKSAVSENHLFEVDDVIEFDIPPKRPEIEFGKLIDDISVRAILVSDVNSARRLPEIVRDEDVRKSDCLRQALKLAFRLKGGVGRQTGSVVVIGEVPADAVSFGCAFGPKNASDVFISWTKAANPPTKTAELIADAGEFITGATRAEVGQEVAACIRQALKPEASELADREFRGAKVECQAYKRDGGGGSVTLYRRFGKSPARPELSREQLASVEQASARIRGKDAAAEQASLAFANWWTDPKVSQSVKVFAMLTARMVYLSERCPSEPLNYAKITQNAVQAGVDWSDFTQGGKHFFMLAEMMASMHLSGDKDESKQQACEAARKYR